MRSILTMFAKSPFKPLGEHMDKVKSCVEQLVPLFQAQNAGNHELVESISEKIIRFEHEADNIKNDIRKHLPQSIFMAVDKKDFANLLSAQDDIADSIEDLAVVLRIKELQTPDEIKEKLTDLVAHVSTSAHKSCDLIYSLEDLMEASFGGVEAEKFSRGCQELAEDEWMADRKQFALAQKLFSLDDTLSPADLILWNEVNKNLGAVSNKTEQIGKTLKIFISK